MRVNSWLLCLCALHAVARTGSDSIASPAPRSPGDSTELQSDPITRFRLMYPAHGAVETSPVEFRAEIGIKSIEEYKTHYGDRVMCVELIKESKWKKCTPMLSPSIVFDGLDVGNYTARAFIADDEDGVYRYHQTSATTFSVVSKKELAAHKAATQEIVGRDAKQPSLVDWARQERRHWEERAIEVNSETAGDHLVDSSMGNGSNVFLLIGVKTAVVKNFGFRQAIRETWASGNALPDDVRVLFIGCTPTFDETPSESEREELKTAIDLEKRVFGDLLTEELHCEDSYDSLTDKVKQFLRFAAQTFPKTPFVMIADDDIYLRADRLADDLRKEDRSGHLYIGQVWDTLLGHSQEPVRESTERYYIPEDIYPLRSYPPFAFGPHYVLSMDCVRFIAKNHKRLRGLDPIDDVSVALWLLTLQVHAEHTPAFSSLGIGVCKRGLISLADLSPFGIQSIHANIVARRGLCDGFDRITWQKGGGNLHETVETYDWNIQVAVSDLHTSKFLEVTSIFSLPGAPSISVSYYPSAESLAMYTQSVCSQIHARKLELKAQGLICPSLDELRTQLQQQFRRLKESGEANLAFMELWRYSLFDSDPELPPFIIAYSDNGVFSSVVLECLFVTIQKDQKRPILVMPESTLRQYYGGAPDVFVFSILDGDCDPVAKPACQAGIAQHFRNYGEGPKPATIMMVAGEPISTQGLDERVILLSTVSVVDHERHAYFSVASNSFAERLDHSPTALLSPSMTYMEQEAVTDRRFCAYLYARCDRPQREYMFDVLNAMEPVDALGICAGSSRLPDASYGASRYSDWYNDDAVTTFQHYKFVIAFENSGVPGYVTEKLVNPFLAGSIPIYLGNSTTVSELFNANSFIDCGKFERLRDCAQFVVKVHRSPELYAQMRREPPIRDVAALNAAFSWHPSVPSRELADKVARLMQRSSLRERKDDTSSSK